MGLWRPVVSRLGSPQRETAVVIRQGGYMLFPQLTSTVKIPISLGTMARDMSGEPLTDVLSMVRNIQVSAEVSTIIRIYPATSGV